MKREALVKAKLSHAMAWLSSVLLLSSCTFDFSNSVDPESAIFEGVHTVSDPTEVLAEYPWISASDGSGEPVFLASRLLGATSYALQVSTNSDFSSPLILDVGDATGNEIPVPTLAAALADGTTYYWRVRAATSAGWGPWSASATFDMTKVTGLTLESARGRSGNIAAIPVAIQPENATCTLLRWSSSDPGAVGVDSQGTLYFKEPGSIATITATSIDGSYNATCVASALVGASAMEAIAGSDEQGEADGIGTTALFAGACAICSDGKKLYVAEDYPNFDIRAIDLQTFEVTRLAGQPGVEGSDDGIGTAASFLSPIDMCTDGSYLYLAELDQRIASGCVIRKISISTGSVTTLAGSSQNLATTDGTGTAAAFTNIRCLCSDGAYLFVSEASSLRRVVTATGEVTTLPVALGDAGYDKIHCDGQVLYCVTLGSKDSLTRLDLDSLESSVITGSDSQLEGCDGLGTSAQLAWPGYGLDGDGKSLFILDTTMTTDGPWIFSIRKLDLASGAVGTIFSSDQSVNDICLSGTYLYSSSYNTIRRLALY